MSSVTWPWVDAACDMNSSVVTKKYIEATMSGTPTMLNPRKILRVTSLDGMSANHQTEEMRPCAGQRIHDERNDGDGEEELNDVQDDDRPEIRFCVLARDELVDDAAPQKHDAHAEHRQEDPRRDIRRTHILDPGWAEAE